MKVTGIVKKYITESVKAKYDPIINSINKKYSDAKTEVDSVIEKTKKELNKIATETFRKALAPYYDTDDLDELMSDRALVASPYRWNVYPSNEKKRLTKVDKLEKEKQKTIDDILITLELGGTKADLDRLLSEVNPETESEEE